MAKVFQPKISFHENTTGSVSSFTIDDETLNSMNDSSGVELKFDYDSDRDVNSDGSVVFSEREEVLTTIGNLTNFDMFFKKPQIINPGFNYVKSTNVFNSSPFVAVELGCVHVKTIWEISSSGDFSTDLEVIEISSGDLTRLDKYFTFDKTLYVRCKYIGRSVSGEEHGLYSDVRVFSTVNQTTLDFKTLYTSITTSDISNGFCSYEKMAENLGWCSQGGYTRDMEQRLDNLFEYGSENINIATRTMVNTPYGDSDRLAIFPDIQQSSGAINGVDKNNLTENFILSFKSVPYGSYGSKLSLFNTSTVNSEFTMSDFDSNMNLNYEDYPFYIVGLNFMIREIMPFRVGSGASMLLGKTIYIYKKSYSGVDDPNYFTYKSIQPINIGLLPGNNLFTLPQLTASVSWGKLKKPSTFTILDIVDQYYGDIDENTFSGMKEFNIMIGADIAESNITIDSKYYSLDVRRLNFDGQYTSFTIRVNSKPINGITYGDCKENIKLIINVDNNEHVLALNIGEPKLYVSGKYAFVISYLNNDSIREYRILYTGSPDGWFMGAGWCDRSASRVYKIEGVIRWLRDVSDLLNTGEVYNGRFKVSCKGSITPSGQSKVETSDYLYGRILQEARNDYPYLNTFMVTNDNTAVYFPIDSSVHSNDLDCRHHNENDLGIVDNPMYLEDGFGSLGLVGYVSDEELRAGMMVERYPLYNDIILRYTKDLALVVTDIKTYDKSDLGDLVNEKTYYSYDLESNNTSVTSLVKKLNYLCVDDPESGAYINIKSYQTSYCAFCRKYHKVKTHRGLYYRSNRAPGYFHIFEHEGYLGQSGTMMSMTEFTRDNVWSSEGRVEVGTVINNEIVYETKYNTPHRYDGFENYSYIRFHVDNVDTLFDPANLLEVNYTTNHNVVSNNITNGGGSNFSSCRVVLGDNNHSGFVWIRKKNISSGLENIYCDSKTANLDSVIQNFFSRKISKSINPSFLVSGDDLIMMLRGNDSGRLWGTMEDFILANSTYDYSSWTGNIYSLQQQTITNRPIANYDTISLTVTKRKQYDYSVNLRIGGYVYSDLDLSSYGLDSKCYNDRFQIIKIEIFGRSKWICININGEDTLSVEEINKIKNEFKSFTLLSSNQYSVSWEMQEFLNTRNFLTGDRSSQNIRVYNFNIANKTNLNTAINMPLHRDTLNLDYNSFINRDTYDRITSVSRSIYGTLTTRIGTTDGIFTLPMDDMAWCCGFNNGSELMSYSGNDVMKIVNSSYYIKRLLFWAMIKDDNVDIMMTSITEDNIRHDETLYGHAMGVRIFSCRIFEIKEHETELDLYNNKIISFSTMLNCFSRIIRDYSSLIQRYPHAWVSTDSNSCTASGFAVKFFEVNFDTPKSIVIQQVLIDANTSYSTNQAYRYCPNSSIYSKDITLSYRAGIKYDYPLPVTGGLLDYRMRQKKYHLDKFGIEKNFRFCTTLSKFAWLLRTDAYTLASEIESSMSYITDVGSYSYEDYMNNIGFSIAIAEKNTKSEDGTYRPSWWYLYRYLYRMYYSFNEFNYSNDSMMCNGTLTSSGYASCNTEGILFMKIVTMPPAGPSQNYYCVCNVVESDLVDDLSDTERSKLEDLGFHVFDRHSSYMFDNVRLGQFWEDPYNSIVNRSVLNSRGSTGQDGTENSDQMRRGSFNFYLGYF